MAEDARLSTALPRHPKLVKLKRRLHAEGCWALVCLFLWASDNRPDGNLQGLSDEDVEISSEWNGEAGVFVAALVEVGFLDGSTGFYVIHDWAEHNPWCASRRSRIEAARRAAAVRWKKVGDAEGMQPATDSHPGRMQSAPNGNAHLTPPPLLSTRNTKKLLSNPSGSDHAAPGEDSQAIEIDRSLEAVWVYYVAELDRHPKLYTWSPLRKKMGAARLRDLWNRSGSLEGAVEMMKICIDRLKQSAFHNGKNAQGKKYIGWEILFRSTEQMEKWLDDDNFREGVAHGM